MYTELEIEIREQEAEALEAYRKGTADSPVLYRAGGHIEQASADEMIFVASEESEDRMGDLIQLDGWDTAAFKSNPVLLFSHRHDIAPVGIVPRLWTNQKQLLNNVKFDVDDPLGAFLKGKYERGFMRAESVGFRVIEFEERSDKAKQRGLPSYIFKKQELLEISLVAVPAHPAAIRKSMGDKFMIVMPQIVEVKDAERPQDQEAWQKIAAETSEILSMLKGASK